MRVLLCVAGFLAVAGAMSTPAQAQNYPWCAYYGGVPGGGGTNCGFTTFEQCMATVSGIAAPNWVELTRSGNSFSAFYSTNGTPVPSNAGVWWRGRISEISGIVVGILGVQE